MIYLLRIFMQLIPPCRDICVNQLNHPLYLSFEISNSRISISPFCLVQPLCLIYYASIYKLNPPHVHDLHSFSIKAEIPRRWENGQGSACASLAEPSCPIGRDPLPVPSFANSEDFHETKSWAIMMIIFESMWNWVHLPLTSSFLELLEHGLKSFFQWMFGLCLDKTSILPSIPNHEFNWWKNSSINTYHCLHNRIQNITNSTSTPKKVGAMWNTWNKWGKEEFWAPGWLDLTFKSLNACSHYSHQPPTPKHSHPLWSTWTKKRGPFLLQRARSALVLNSVTLSQTLMMMYMHGWDKEMRIAKLLDLQSF